MNKKIYLFNLNLINLSLHNYNFTSPALEKCNLEIRDIVSELKSPYKKPAITSRIGYWCFKVLLPTWV